MSAPQDTFSDRLPRRTLPERNALTEDELRLLKECQFNSFWYRSVPFAIISMMATHVLIHRGKLSTQKFGAFPKIAFAGFFGLYAGKISYMNECRQKFLKLNNSQMVDKELRLQTQFSQHTDSPSELSQADTAPQQSFAPVAAEPPSSVYSSKYESSAVEVPFSASMSESSPTGIQDTVLVEPELIEQAPSKQRPVTYDELRGQNRELQQRAAVSPSRAPVQEKKPWKEGVPGKIPGKKNQYGDVWDE